MRCAACGTENAGHRKFCDGCGAALPTRCPNCGAVDPGTRYCGECGASLGGAGANATTSTGADALAADPATATERRVCSVLFADLVGFTSLSETRDAEVVRELLSGYFELARTVIARYGGTVEKFVGDAVMAVWGVPGSHEDDAERSVRAALDLVDAVTGFGESAAAPGLAARAGVVTGEVAVALGATGQGMVAGDAVNTAARVQAAAQPGAVLVDDTTRSATARAIGFAEAGAHSLKGKAEPVRVWRATRVLGSVGGAERVDGLEASFLRRDREFRALKDAFHATVEQGRARLVSVLGVAGVGKSRLGWEFEKYVDGLAAGVLWHAGRCLSYGDGVAYWALAQMVRQRFGIAEEQGGEAAAHKLAAGLERWIADPADRDYLAPRLGALLGLADPGLGREELFAGWRLFFERLADQDPVVLAFEDSHWADAGLLDFVEHLLDWSAQSPILVLSLARPELADRRAHWAAGRRNASMLMLDPLPAAAIRELLDELVPGLPGPVANRIVAQADGIPLYAVETVRTLVDRDLVRPIDGVYRLVGAVEELQVPASLASLIAARIDALPAEERALVQDLAVLGTTFGRPAAGAVSRLADAELDRFLADLVHREILAVRADRLSPDRGQYTFTQGLLRQVAYGTLSRRERKARHLQVAGHLRTAFPDDGAEVAEVLAQHYRDALEAVPADPDTAEIRNRAVAAYRRAAERAAAVGAPAAGSAAYRAAAALVTGEHEHAELTARAGEQAALAGEHATALELLEAAHGWYAEHDDREAVRLACRVAQAHVGLGRNHEAVVRLRAALAVVDSGKPDPDTALVAGMLGRVLAYDGEEEAAPLVETALSYSQALELPRVLAEAFLAQGMLLESRKRPEEALVSYRAGAAVAERVGRLDLVSLGRGNAANLLIVSDLPGADLEVEATLAVDRRRGNRYAEANAISNLALAHLFAGRWDAAKEECTEALADPGRPGAEHLHGRLCWLAAMRGDPAGAEHHLAGISEWSTTDNVESRSMYLADVAALELARDRPAAALGAAREALAVVLKAFGLRGDPARQAWPDALEAAVRAGQLAEAEELLALVADALPGYSPPFLWAQHARYRARLAAARRDDDAAEGGFRRAEEMLAELGYPYWLASAQLDHAEWLADRHRDAKVGPLLAAAERVFDLLGAAPPLRRARALAARADAPAGETV